MRNGRTPVGNTLCLFTFNLSLLFLCGCAATVTLHPFRGPLASQMPPPVLVSKIKNYVVDLNGGRSTVVLPSGEACTGKWSPRRPRTAMASTWDAIYGPGFYVSHVETAGWYYGATLTGDKGTILNIELETYNQRSSNSLMYGVAQDNSGNSYEVDYKP
jgi:hypothetical protein